MERRMERALLIVESTVIRKLSIGQPVRRTASGRLIGLDPSRPGEPPKVLYGRLRQSVSHAQFKSGGTLHGQIGAHTVYARALEMEVPGRLLPRPYLRPSLAEHEQDIVRILNGGGQ
jgi:hypothetical protein